MKEYNKKPNCVNGLTEDPSVYITDNTGRKKIADIYNDSVDCFIEREKNSFDNIHNSHYDEFAGSYAQDVMNYSDEDINDAFDGDPDAYWNID